MPKLRRTEDVSECKITVRFDEMEVAQIDGVLDLDETRSDLVRIGTMREVRRRQAAERKGKGGR